MANGYTGNIDGFSDLLKKQSTSPLGNATTVFGGTGVPTDTSGFGNFTSLGEMDFSNLLADQTGINQAGQLQNGLGGQISTGGLTQGADSSFFSNGNLNTAATGLSALNGLLSAYTGIKGLGLAKDQFNYQKDLSNTNLENSANLTNERLATRQATRLRSAGETDQSVIDSAVSDYIQKYGANTKAGG